VEPREYIARSVRAGDLHGLEALNALQRAIYLIALVERDCDAGRGLAAFAERRGRDGLLEASAAFAAVGAVRIAEQLSVLAANLPELDARGVEGLDRLVRARADYGAGAVEAFVGQCLADSGPQMTPR
jgi:hypothetical protein